MIREAPARRCDRSRPRPWAVSLVVFVSLLGWLAGRAHAQSTGRITGSVQAAGTGTRLAGVTVLLSTAAVAQVASATTDATGAYALTGLASGTYYLATRNSLGYIDELYHGRPCPTDDCVMPTGTGVSVANGATTSGIDFGLVKGGTITGTVTDATTNAALAGVSVPAYDAIGRYVATAMTTSAGTYTLNSLVPGTYYLNTRNLIGYPNQVYVDTLYKDKPCSAFCPVLAGTGVTVTAGVTTGQIDFALPKSGAIAGKVTEAATKRPLSGVSIYAYDAGGSVMGSTQTDASGGYSLGGYSGLPMGITSSRRWACLVCSASCITIIRAPLVSAL